MADLSGGTSTSARSRWLSVGRSADPDSRRAGAEATRQAIQGEDPKILVVFGSADYDAAALIAGIRQAAPDVPIVGCSTRGEITPDGPADRAVVVTAIGGPGFTISTAFAEDAGSRQREAGDLVAQCAADVPDLRYKVLFLLNDGFIRFQENILRGAYGVVGASVPLFGGSAAAKSPAECYQIHNDRVLHNSVVAMTIASDAPIGIGVRHGWHAVGDAMVVTHSDQARVFTLDNEPALDAYLHRLNAPPEAYRDPEAFSRWTLTRPLGVQRRSGLAAKNISHEVDFDGRSIGGGAEILQGALLWATEGCADSILDAVEEACQEAIDALQDNPPIGLFTLSCLGCRAVLGDDGIKQEVSLISGRAKGTPFAGFYTLGEIARTRGIEGFHNQTFVVLALS